MNVATHSQADPATDSHIKVAGYSHPAPPAEKQRFQPLVFSIDQLNPRSIAVIWDFIKADIRNVAEKLERTIFLVKPAIHFCKNRK